MSGKQRVFELWRGFRANPRKAAASAGAWNPHFGGECAVYMMAKGPPKARETGFLRPFTRAYSAKVGTGFASPYLRRNTRKTE
jgi:hypothetical protein